MEKFSFTDEERQQAYKLIKFIKSSIKDSLQNDDERKIYHYFNKAIKDGTVQRDTFGLNPILNGLCTAQIAIEEIGLGRDGVVAIMLYSIMEEQPDEQNVSADFGESVNRIIHGLLRIRELYKKSPVIESENFRNLLLSFAEDMRVILIMIADRVNLMRQIRDTDNEEARHRISEEASYLYAPLAHKLGLYKLKSELEIKGRLHRTIYRSDTAAFGRSRPQVPHERPYKEHSFDMAEDEETKMWVRGNL